MSKDHPKTSAPLPGAAPDPLAGSKIPKASTGEKVGLGTSSGITLSNEGPPGSTPPPPSDEEAPPETEDDPNAPPPPDPPEAVLVPILDTSTLKRTAKWRVLENFKVHWKGQRITFAKGQTFGADTFPPEARAGFFEAGLQAEAIE